MKNPCANEKSLGFRIHKTKNVHTKEAPKPNPLRQHKNMCVKLNELIIMCTDFAAGSLLGFC